MKEIYIVPQINDALHDALLRFDLFGVTLADRRKGVPLPTPNEPTLYQRALESLGPYRSPPAPVPLPPIPVSIRIETGISWLAVLANLAVYMLLYATLVLPWHLFISAKRRLRRFFRCDCGYSRDGLSPHSPCPECGRAGPLVQPHA